MKNVIQNNSQKAKLKNHHLAAKYFFDAKYIPIDNNDTKSYSVDLLKAMVKIQLDKEGILFTENKFGIYINMTGMQYRIAFSESPVGYKIYTDTGFELGCSNDRFMSKNDVFEALGWTMLEIVLYFDYALPFNVYAMNDGEVA